MDIVTFTCNNIPFSTTIKERLPNGTLILEYCNSDSNHSITSITFKNNYWRFSDDAIAENIQFSLSNYNAAFVLPITPDNFVYLGRETKGRDIEKFDSFGGRVDKGDNNNPLKTACREFEEEGLTKLSLLLSREQLYEYIPHNLHQQLIIGKLILYIVIFPEDKMQKFTENYRSAYYQTQIGEGLHEKDEIAKVNFDDLLHCIKSGRSRINADVVDLNGNKMKKEIELRGVIQNMLLHY